MSLEVKDTVNESSRLS